MLILNPHFYNLAEIQEEILKLWEPVSQKSCSEIPLNKSKAHFERNSSLSLGQTQWIRFCLSPASIHWEPAAVRGPHSSNILDKTKILQLEHNHDGPDSVNSGLCVSAVVPLHSAHQSLRNTILNLISP